ncbi:MAG: 3-dehydroquinate synthase [Magnetococcales bacterium]|nr:3-dehydroquinate synthase [Magnetococcales bacterium]
MFETITIQSRSGPYSVSFTPDLLDDIGEVLQGTPHCLVDANIARLYSAPLAAVLAHPNTLIIESTEGNKSINSVIPVIERLVENKIRRGHVLVAIGGGIIQDITCFIASTLLRGVEWRFIPTTLLAQADSCIGSKSSINLGEVKNILGTFNPPKHIWICPAFLDTLEPKEVRSGIGEILKVHAIAGQAAFDNLKKDFGLLAQDRQILLTYIRSALLIKKKYIEIDEFDQGVRNIFNYGHSFGHAIESATHFAIPHGVAVTMGMDIANHIAVLRGLLAASHRDRMHDVFRKNYQDFIHVPIVLEDMLGALMKDKKNTATELMLIFPVGDRAEIQRIGVSPDEIFRGQCRQIIGNMWL